MFKILTHLNRSCLSTSPKNPPIRFMLSFMGQGQSDKIGKIGKLAIFACEKRISENPKYVAELS